MTLRSCDATSDGDYSLAINEMIMSATQELVLHEIVWKMLQSYLGCNFENSIPHLSLPICVCFLGQDVKVSLPFQQQKSAPFADLRCVLVPCKVHNPEVKN